MICAQLVHPRLVAGQHVDEGKLHAHGLGPRAFVVGRRAVVAAEVQHALQAILGVPVPQLPVRRPGGAVHLPRHHRVEVAQHEHADQVIPQRNGHDDQHRRENPPDQAAPGLLACRLLLGGRPVHGLSISRPTRESKRISPAAEAAVTTANSQQQLAPDEPGRRTDGNNGKDNSQKPAAVER